MSGTTGADLFVEALERYGASHVFGNPGTTELPVADAVARSDLDYVLAPHEDVAVGMAAGYASTRRYHADRPNCSGIGADADEVLPLGVANLHLAPGLAHGLGNLYGAAMAGAPVLVTSGTHAADFQQQEPPLSADLVGMVDQFTKWSGEVGSVEALPGMLRRAVREALTPPTGPVYLALPLDVMQAKTVDEPERLGPIPSGGRGNADDVAVAGELLAVADDVALIVGDGIARSGQDAVEAVVDLAEAAGARVHGEILACEVNFPTDHEQFAGVIPPNAERARAAMDADLVCFVGCSTHTTLTDPGEPLLGADTTCVHVGVDSAELGKRYPVDAAVVGDPGSVASELADVLDAELDAEVRRARRHEVHTWIEGREGTADAREAGPNRDRQPTALDLADAMETAAADAFVVDEGVTAKYALFDRIDFDYPDFLSNKGGGLGYGLPAAVGAAIAERESGDPRDVVAFVGDGSYLYYPNAIYSAVRDALDLTVVVADNRGYEVVAEGAVDMLGADRDSTDSYASFNPPVDLAANAESYGARGEMVDSVGELTSAISDALARNGTDVVDVVLDEGDSELR